MNVLRDHFKERKRLVAPLNKLGTIVETSWVNDVLPDIVWSGIINNSYGYKEGAEVYSATIEVISRSTKHDNNIDFEYVSSYECCQFLGSEIELLKNCKLYAKIESALADFFVLFPECPIINAFGFHSENTEVSLDMINSFKSMLNMLLDKTSIESTFAIANIVYSLFRREKLFVPHNSVLSRFPEVSDYPNSEISVQIAAALRSFINIKYTQNNSNVSNWVSYFWKRCYEMEPLQL